MSSLCVGYHDYVSDIQEGIRYHENIEVIDHGETLFIYTVRTTFLPHKTGCYTEEIFPIACLNKTIIYIKYIAIQYVIYDS